ncbi:ABC transporter ATP-binding protein [Pseudactinotalea sp. Z1732]|uniref:ABC transporter ATP-binding protein n=1 Tax=Micrococcales TaxID=85006 RepID=UPI003C7A759B
MNEWALDLQSLRRTFRRRGQVERIALDNVDLRLPARASSGLVHGLLGPNGAGKTTICKIVATVLLPTSGRARVLGHDVVTEAAAVRRLIGIVFGGERGLYDRLSAMENLQFWCAMHGLGARAGRRRSTELLERLGLGERATEKVETFSRGMKQRLHLARGLVAEPRVLLLDEPTVGMDPVSARDFRTLVTELRGEGRTVLLTTHDMAEAQALCDSVTFIDQGRVLGTGPPAQVRAMVAGSQQITVDDVDPASAEALTGALGTLPDAAERIHAVHDARSGVLQITVSGGAEAVSTALRTVLAAGHTQITSAPPSLEDVYLDLLGTDAAGQRRGMDV